MSFDLYLSRRDGNALDLDAVKRWADDHGNFTAGPRASLSYANAITGVYFTVGSEPVLANLSSELDLIAANPQGHGEPEPFDAKALLATYITSNTRAVAAIAGMGGLVDA
jgi:hypothetical protein